MAFSHLAVFISDIFRLKHLLGLHYVLVPKSIADSLNLSESRRFICSLNGKISWQCGLVCLSQGNYYITVSNKRLNQLGLKEGDEVSVKLELDASIYGMEVPEELFELLQQDEEGCRRFDILTSGRKRYIIGYVAGVKNPAKRLNRALLLIRNLKKLPEGNEQFRELLGKLPRD